LRRRRARWLRLPLLLCAGAALWIGGVVALYELRADDGGLRGRAGVSQPERPAPEAARPVAQQAPRRGAADAQDAPLCVAPGDMTYAAPYRGLGLAAEPAGRFALYGAPGPDGRPTADYYDVLRGCAPQLDFLNRLTAQVRGRGLPPRTTADLGAGTLERGTVRVRPRVLRTAHRAPGGIVVEQELALVGGDGSGAGALRMSYTVRNEARLSRRVSLRQLLSPPPAPEGRAPYLAPALAGVPPEENGGAEVRYEKNLMGPYVVPVEVPRPGAAGDSTAVWRPSAEGIRPSRVTFAHPLPLGQAAFLYPIRLGYPLPEEAGMAVHWEGIPVGAGASVTVSHRYELVLPHTERSDQR